MALAGGVARAGDAPAPHRRRAPARSSPPAAPSRTAVAFSRAQGHLPPLYVSMLAPFTAVLVGAAAESLVPPPAARRAGSRPQTQQYWRASPASQSSSGRRGRSCTSFSSPLLSRARRGRGSGRRARRLGLRPRAAIIAHRGAEDAAGARSRPHDQHRDTRATRQNEDLPRGGPKKIFFCGRTGCRGPLSAPCSTADRAALSKGDRLRRRRNSDDTIRDSPGPNPDEPAPALDRLGRRRGRARRLLRAREPGRHRVARRRRR